MVGDAGASDEVAGAEEVETEAGAGAGVVVGIGVGVGMGVGVGAGNICSGCEVVCGSRRRRVGREEVGWLYRSSRRTRSSHEQKEGPFSQKQTLVAVMEEKKKKKVSGMK